VAFYVAPGYVTLPGGDWFDVMLAARRELDAIPEDVRLEELRQDDSRASELDMLLDTLEGATLHDADGGVVEGLNLAFLYFSEKSHMLVLAVIIEAKIAGGPYTTPFDRLFEGKYDPEKLKLTAEDTPYVIVRLDEHNRPMGVATVIQPYAEDVPRGVCSSTVLPRGFISHLFELA